MTAAKLVHLVALARAEVGVTEATGRNDGPRVEEYLGGHDERGLSWCAAFVLWLYVQAGFRWRGNRWLLRRVSTLFELARKAGALLEAREVPEPGDLVMWIGRNAHASAGPSGHVAIVVGVAPHNSFDHAESIELEIVAGNENNQVVLRRIDSVDVRITAIARPSRGMVEAA